MGPANFRTLKAWQQAIVVVKDIYALVKKLPADEKYVLGDQLRRAVISIPSNIAEGQSRGTDREFIHFLSIANGSASEIETQLIIGAEVGLFTQEEIEPILEQVNFVHALIRNLQKTIEEKLKNSRKGLDRKWRFVTATQLPNLLTSKPQNF